MTEPFIGEIQMFGGSFAPRGWALCDGQLLRISGNDALFSLLGTTYGGDGETYFALPDLRGRTPMHQGPGPGLTNRTLGSAVGEETVTLASNEMPGHSHAMRASTQPADESTPAGASLAAAGSTDLYVADAPDVLLAAEAVPDSGATAQPHDNVAPFLAVHFIISLSGIYPSED